MAEASEQLFGDYTPEQLQEAMRSDVINVMVDSSADIAIRYYERLVASGMDFIVAGRITAAFVQGGMGTQ